MVATVLLQQDIKLEALEIKRKPPEIPVDLLRAMLEGRPEGITREQLAVLLQAHASLFVEAVGALGRSNIVQHEILTEGHRTRRRPRPYRVSHAEAEFIEKQVVEMLDAGVIRPLWSDEWSPVVIVRKKDGYMWFCVDYRALNAIMIKDVYPLPRIDDHLDELGGSTYFSVMDLVSGYWQIELAEKDRRKSAFVTKQGLFEYNVMPIGVCNGPATFQRMMDCVMD